MENTLQACCCIFLLFVEFKFHIHLHTSYFYFNFVNTLPLALSSVYPSDAKGVGGSSFLLVSFCHIIIFVTGLRPKRKTLQG